MELQTVDPVAWVSARPAQFFRGATINALQLIPWILGDVIFLGGGECRVTSENAWWFVSSNIDWMKSASFSISELFTQVVADPRLGQHSMRSEILLNAFATAVFTSDSVSELSIKGEPPGTGVVAKHVDWAWAKRLLIFKVDERARVEL